MRNPKNRRRTEMRRYQSLSIWIILFTIAACVATQKKVNEYWVYEKESVQFKEPSGVWSKRNLDASKRFGNFCRFDHKREKAKIWVRVRYIKAKTERKVTLEDLENSGERWINAMAKKYHWKELKIISKGQTKINEEESSWQEYEFKMNNKYYIEKIYKTYLNRKSYQFRLSSSNEAYKDLVIEFDNWVETIKFIR